MNEVENAAAAVKLEGFGAAFGRRVALASIDLAVQRRETVMLVGPAGVGKASVLRAAAGKSRLRQGVTTWGSVSWGGEDRRGSQRRLSLLEQRVGQPSGTVHELLAGGLPERHLLTVLKRRDLLKDRQAGFGLSELCLKADVAMLQQSEQRT